MKKYNENGWSDLNATNPKGRGSGKGRTKVSDEVFKSLKEEMAQTPEKKWTLKEQQEYVEEQSGEKMTVQAVAYRMKKI